jgi:hypothetical protein
MMRKRFVASLPRPERVKAPLFGIGAKSGKAAALACLKICALTG